MALKKSKIRCEVNCGGLPVSSKFQVYVSTSLLLLAKSVRGGGNNRGDNIIKTQMLLYEVISSFENRIEGYLKYLLP